MDKDCIFCKIANHEAPASIELETKNVIAFPSIAPAAQKHILIVPKIHVVSFTNLEKTHKDILMEMAEVAQKLIEMKKITNGYKLVFNGGKYQSVPHIHWHLLGGKLENEDQAISKT